MLRCIPLATLSFVLAAPRLAASGGGSADTFHLTDEPGNWFRSEATGTPVSIVKAGDRVDFKIDDCCTNTRHTVTLLVKPAASAAAIDQDSSQKGTLSLRFDAPGVYVLICKIHPYMTAVVAATDDAGAVPDVEAAALPFIAHLGLPSLPASTVLSVMTTVAATDDDKRAKWDLRVVADERRPSVPGVGEVWVDTQFERVPAQTDGRGVEKPGTITVVDAATFAVEREIDGRSAGGLWNNPHNLWATFALDAVYNTNWFGKWLNKIDRASGAILSSVEVGEAPTHVVTIPTQGSPEFGVLTIPLSAEHDLVKVEDRGGRLRLVDSDPTGRGRNHPHGHWLTCGRGDRVVVPNVFKGIGVGGSVSVLDTGSGRLLAEFVHDPADPLRAALRMPLAVGECHVDGTHKAYVANAVSGLVTVLDVDALRLLKNVPVTIAPDGTMGRDLLHTLQVPIQTPVSPDERWVATAVLSLTTVARPMTGAPDHVAVIDTGRDEVVAILPAPGGAHGVNWGAKKGGGYYAWVTSQHSNVLTVLDPDPDGDGDGRDAAVAGTILLANGSAGAGVTDGTGGQGVKPLPMTHDGWIQPTVELARRGRVSPEVASWIAALTDEQKDPGDHRGRSR
jgi:plastocyanin